MTISSDSAQSRSALEALALKKFRDWRGLPPDCSMRDVLSVFRAQDFWIGRAKLGSEYVDTNFRFAIATQWETPLRVWLRSDVVVEIEAESPELDVAQLVADLDRPKFTKLDAHYGVALLPRSEWVCAERGIAFQTDSAGVHVLLLYVFAATTADEYVRTLRVNRPQRPIPTR
jgi:hypothetical protein